MSKETLESVKKKIENFEAVHSRKIAVGAGLILGLFPVAMYLVTGRVDLAVGATTAEIVGIGFHLRASFNTLRDLEQRRDTLLKRDLTK